MDRGSHTPAGTTRSGRRSAADPAADAYYLDRAIDFAWLGAGKTHTNPMVGAVVVKDGAVIGEGYHDHFGGDHAEVMALKQAGDEARGATLYASLEPCVHEGKTPPCVDRILEAGVKRVVFPTRDPDPRVSGRCVDRLESAEVDVSVGTRAERALVLNMGYFKRQVGLGGAVTVKMALTVDGCIASAPGVRDQITGAEALEFVHRLRAVHDGVLVGVDTVRVDRPRLDCRLLQGVQDPVPVVFDSALRCPDDHQWKGRRFVVCSGTAADAARARAIEATGGRVLDCGAGGRTADVHTALEKLAREGIRDVLVEGGGRVFSSFLESGRWDVMHVFVSPKLFGPEGVGLGGGRFDIGAVPVHARRMSQDVLISYINQHTMEALRGRLA